MKNMVLVLLAIIASLGAQADFSAEHLAAVTKRANQLSFETVMSKQDLKLIHLSVELGKRSFNPEPFFKQFTDYQVSIKYGVGASIVVCDVSIMVRWENLKKRDASLETILENHIDGEHQLIMTNRRPFCYSEDVQR